MNTNVGAIALPGLGLAGPRQKKSDAGYVEDLIKKGLTSLATVLTNAGAAIITNRLNSAGTVPNFVGWGTSATAAAVTDTALGAEAAPTSTSRSAGTVTRVTTTVTNDTFQVAQTVTSGGTLAITEMGLFDAATTGNLFIHSVFTAVNVNSGDSIAFTTQTKISTP